MEYLPIMRTLLVKYALLLYAIVTNILDINGTCTIIQTVYIYFNIHVVMYLPDT